MNTLHTAFSATVLLMSGSLLAEVATPQVMADQAQNPSTSKQVNVDKIKEEDINDANNVIVVTAARLPKYHVSMNTSASLVEMPQEEVPFTVDSLTSDFIKERAPSDLDQLLSYQPGIFQGGKTVMARSAGSYTIRGFGGNEVLLGTMPLSGGIGTFFDPSLLERVDIVKGPVGGAYGGQSNSYDQSGGGGTIILKQKQPIFGEDFTDLSLSGTSGHGTGYQGKFTSDSNYTLSDTVAIRVPIAYTLRNPDWAAKGADYGKTFSTAPSILWLAEDRLDITLNTFFQRSDQPANQGIPTLNGDPLDGYGWDDSTTLKNDYMFFETYGVNLTLEGQLNETWRTRTQLSAMRTDNRYKYRGPTSGKWKSDTQLQQEHTNRVTQWETYLTANPNGAITQPMINALYADSNYEWAQGDRTDTAFYVGQQFSATFDTGDIWHDLLIGVDYSVKVSKGEGRFGHGEYMYDANGNPILDASGNQLYRPIDYDKEGNFADSMEYDYDRQSKIGFLLQDVLTWDDWRFLAGIRADYHDSIDHDKAWSYSPRLGLSYLFSEEVIAFANLSMTQTPNFNTKTEGDNVLDGNWEALQQEIGLRWNPSGTMWIQGTVFRIDQTNVPEYVGLNNMGQSIYAANDERNTQGFEFSMNGDITPNWSIYAAYTYVDDLSRDFDSTPPHSLGIWTSYRVQALHNSVIGLGYRYRDPWRMTLRGQDQGEAYEVEALHTFDTSIDIPVSESSSITFAVRNIFDERGIESARNLQAFVNEGRTFQISYDISF